MERIIEEYKKGIQSKFEYDLDKFISENHLYAVIHNEIFENNYHSRIKYNGTPKPEIRRIKMGDEYVYWCFIPTIVPYLYDQPYTRNKNHPYEAYKKIKDICKPFWTEIDSIFKTNPKQKFIIDCRSLEMRGAELLSVFVPFILPTGITVEKTTNPDIGSVIYIGNQPPFISNREPVPSIPLAMSQADITFIVDKTFAKVKDMYFTLLIASLSERYKIYGDMGDNVGYIFNQYAIDPNKYKINNLERDSVMIIRIPDTKVRVISNEIVIPQILTPYKLI